MRYPTRAFQSDTTVVSNDRRHPHHVSQTKAAPANPSGRLSPTLLTKPPTYQVPKSRVICRSSDTCCDARCLTRCHLASVSDSCHFFRTSQTCTCGGYTTCSCRRAHACSSGTVFVAVTVDRGRCAPSGGYARPAVGSRPRSRENMVAVNADALVRLTRAVLPAISPTPLRYRLPLWSPTTATAIADRPARANSS